MSGVSIDRDVRPTRPTWTMRVSWNGRLTAYGGNALWIYDRDRATARRLKESMMVSPVWAPGDTTIAVAAMELQPTACRLVLISLGGRQDTVVTAANSRASGSPSAGCFYPTDWTRDGAFLVLSREPLLNERSGAEIWIWSARDRTFSREFAAEANVSDGVVSPDGRWLAYVSDETGGPQVFVRPFRRAGPNERVSTRGGATPRWSRDGRWLHFVTPEGQIMRSSIEPGEKLALGVPTEVLVVRDRDLQFFSETPDGFLVTTPFDVSPDPDRFVTMMGRSEGPQAQLLLDWMSLLDSTRVSRRK